MSNIMKLLENCSVEWRALGEIAAYEQPTKYLVKATNYSDDFETPVLTAGKTFILGYTNETDGIYKASKSPVIIFDDFTTANKWVDFDFKAKSSAMKMISSKNESICLLRYIYFWLNTLPAEQADNDHKRQWISNFANKQIPIPSLTIQREIVRILDNFTELNTELNTELAARKKQYAYYRDALLSYTTPPCGHPSTGGEYPRPDQHLAPNSPPLEGWQAQPDGVVSVEWKTLGEVFDILAGGDAPKAALSEIETEEFNVPILSNGIGVKSLYGWTDVAKIHEPSLTISARGTIGWTSYRDTPFFPIVRLIVLTPKVKVNLKYAYLLHPTLN